MPEKADLFQPINACHKTQRPAQEDTQHFQRTHAKVTMNHYERRKKGHENRLQDKLGLYNFIHMDYFARLICCCE